MSSTKVTFVTGTAEVRRRDPNRGEFGPPPNEHLTTEPNVPSQVTFVDGKCSCCPYGYHIDLDFLNFCKDVETGSTLRNLKKIQRTKRKLRKSMEIMLDEQEGIAADPNSAPPDVVHSTEAGRLMHMINYERSATHRILNQIDSSVNTTIANIDGRGRRYMSSDSDDPVTPYSAPSYGYQEPGGPSFNTSGRTDSLSSLSSVSTVSSEAPMLHQAQLIQQQHHQKQYYQGMTAIQQQQQQHQSQQSSRIIKTTTEVIENPCIEMATAEMKYQENPVVELGTAEMKHYSTHSSAQLASNGHDEVDFTRSPKTPPAPPPRTSPSPDINQMSLHSVREAMAVSLQRLRELEEQVKAIPILQVRISVLKEEKRLLNLQLKASKANSRPSTRTVGVGVDFSPMPSPKTPPPTLPKPVRTFSVGTGDNSVIEPYLLQPNLPTGYTIRENETHTEIQSTTVIERDSVFSSRIRAPSLNMSFQQHSGDDRNSRLSSSYYSTSESQPHFTIKQIQRSTPKALTRSIGVGEGNVYEGGLHVHEKEFRTVFIGQNANVAKRNVGIECRVPTRDVGVSFMCDEEKPETRTVGVNVNYDMSGIHTSLDFKGEKELRVALRDVLQRSVRSVGTNCNFKPATADAATLIDQRQGVDVGVGDAEMRIDVEIRMPTTRKSAYVTAKPETNHKCVSTEKGWALDVGTNTVQIDKYNKACLTDRQRVMVAATNTEPQHNRQTGVQTETKMFLAMDQLKNAASITDKVSSFSTGIMTESPLVYNAATNTTEKVTDLFRKEEEQKTMVTTTEFITKERKPLMFDKAVGDGVIEDPYSFSETTEIISKTFTPVKTGSSSVEEQILQRGTNQANAFLSQTKERDDSSIYSYEISRRSAAVPVITKSQEVIEQKSSPSRESPTKGEEGFSETVIEHYIINDTGEKRLVSREKERSTTSGATSKTYEDLSSSGSYGNGDTSWSGQSSSVTSSSAGSSRYGSEDREITDGITSNTSYSTYSSSTKGGTGGSFGDSSSSSSSSTGGSGQYGSSGLGSRAETISTTIVTNPYRTVENLAAASSMLGQDSTDSATSSASGRMSKTSSEGNLYKNKRHSAIELRQSMDTIYDMRRSGSVEDFMPDDIRRYMSIDPSHSKDSGFGEDLLQRFTEESTSSSSSSTPRSPERSGIPKSMQFSKTVTTKRIIKTGADGKTVTQETKSVTGSDGQTTITVTETGEDGVPREIESSVQTSDASMTQSSISLSSSTGFSSDRYGRGSESNLSSGRVGAMTSDTTSHAYSEGTLSTLDTVEEEDSKGSYGSLDRKTGKLKSIMKQTKGETEDSEKSGRKAITFAESVIGGTGSSTEDDEEEGDGATSDSDSTTSFEEGSYDSRQGEVSYRCKDDEAIAQGIPGAQMFDQNIRETYELTEEMREACNTLSTYLMDSTSIRTTQLNASLNTIQQEWFRVSSHKLSSPHQVEDYLSSVNEISKRLLEYIINMADANGNTAIHYCISHCNFEIANLLLDSELCDINKQNKAGYTPIMLAGLATPQNMEQREVVRQIFTMGDINARAGTTQQTALMLAASHGRTEMVMMLVEGGADVNLQDVDGSTALMCACEHGHLEIVNYLLAHPSIDATITDNEGSTALTIAMEAGHKDVGVVLYKHLNFSPKASSPQFRYSVKTKQTSESVL